MRAGLVLGIMGDPADAAPPRPCRLQTPGTDRGTVFGQIKTCQKLTMMSRRGLTASESEWLLASAAHNLRKLHRHRIEG